MPPHSSAIDSCQQHVVSSLITQRGQFCCFQVADLKPGGVLHRAVTSGSNELQQHLPDSFRKQYLHELFPDLSLEANFIEEPDHHELVVLRDDVFNASFGADISRCASLTLLTLPLQCCSAQCQLAAMERHTCPSRRDTFCIHRESACIQGSLRSDLRIRST